MGGRLDMQKNMFRKTLVIGIILIFLFSSLITMSIGYEVKVEDVKEQTS
ncbi:unnamed protein product, partial [marine sediment metagenome]